MDPGGPAAPLVPAGITSDPDWLEAMQHDPRRFEAFVTNKSAHSLLKLVNEVKYTIPSVTVPFLLIHGGDDKICLPQGSEYIHRRAG